VLEESRGRGVAPLAMIAPCCRMDAVEWNVPTATTAPPLPWLPPANRHSFVPTPMRSKLQMEMETLRDLYVEELKDLYSAENQILKALPRMIKAATHPKLKKAFTRHEKQTRQHVKRLERICKELGEKPTGKKCVGMEGVLKEGKELISEKPEKDVLDAGLISAAQHVEHYEMAGYGTCRTWARLLGYESQAQLLQTTLDEEQQTDLDLTGLAESTVNIDAEE
jgi:ferritin-like metal-binding protein YciE